VVIPFASASEKKKGAVEMAAPMREKRTIETRDEIDAVIHGSAVCRIAMALDNRPYVIPLSFGYDGKSVYVHTGMKGKKIDHFLNNRSVCFEVEREAGIRENGEKACRWSFTYETVIGYGTIREITEPVDREQALNEIMRHYSGRAWPFDEEALARTRLWRIDLDRLTGKRNRTS